jgi:transcriptional regulator with XRE-family HTH domain
MTQVDVAVAIGVGRTHITNIEKGKDPASRELLIAAAAFFGVSLDYLVHGTQSDGIHTAKNESLLIDAFREIAPEDADHLLGMAQALASKSKRDR